MRLVLVSEKEPAFHGCIDLTKPGKDQYTTVGAYDDPRSVEEVEKSIAWDQLGNVEFLRERYKVCSQLTYLSFS